MSVTNEDEKSKVNTLLLVLAKEKGISISDPDLITSSKLYSMVNAHKSLAILITEIRNFNERISGNDALDMGSGIFDVDYVNAVLAYLDIPENERESSEDWVFQTIIGQPNTVFGNSAALDRLMCDLMLSAVRRKKRGLEHGN